MKEISKSKGWNLLRWITRDDNVRAKSLYNRVSEKTNWDVYELKWKNFISKNLFDKSLDNDSAFDELINFLN